jgi:hypothetical protein
MAIGSQRWQKNEKLWEEKGKTVGHEETFFCGYEPVTTDSY